MSLEHKKGDIPLNAMEEFTFLKLKRERLIGSIRSNSEEIDSVYRRVMRVGARYATSHVYDSETSLKVVSGASTVYANGDTIGCISPRRRSPLSQHLSTVTSSESL
jgi:hypothetical protein